MVLGFSTHVCLQATSAVKHKWFIFSIMLQRCLILFRCFNKVWGEMFVETDESFPTSERALEIYKNALKETPLGKEHPSWIEESTVEEKPMVIFSVILDEEKTLKSII